mmetsp:Transcript_25870/g.59982  ORF Transcript_25870/g.59982 Transcript_25870/m.59982 type:complete len:257 (+) Transcript_25870:28-798(+)
MADEPVTDSLATASFKAPPPSKAITTVPPKALSQVPPPVKAVSLVPDVLQAAQAKAGFKASASPPPAAPPAPSPAAALTVPPPAAVPAPTAAGVPAPLVDPGHIDPAWEVPTADESALPKEDDGEGWLELLRDGYFRQLREENEVKQPPPYPRAMNFGSPSGHLVPAGKYPRVALELQRQVLMKFRPDPPNPLKGKGYGGKGGKGMMGGMGDWGMDWNDWSDWSDWGMGWGMMDMMGMKGGWGKGKGGMGKKGMPY